MPVREKKPLLLILVRHGETPWTLDRRFQGHTDTQLTANGRKQARAAAKQLRALKPDLLYCSALWRARETAQFAAAACGLKIKADARLNELGFGRWEGKTAGQLTAEGDRIYRRWCRGLRTNPPGGETLKHFEARIVSFIKDLRRSKAKRIVIVSHGGPIKLIIFRLLGLPFKSLWSLRLDPASVTQVTVFPEFSQLMKLNDTAHLDKAS